MSDKPEAQTLPAHHQHWVWLVPLFVILLVGVIVWRNLPEAGSPVVVLIEDATGLEPDQTRLRYRGVDVGKVKKVTLSDDTKQVEVELSVHQEVLSLMREQTRFWLVSPEINAKGIKGIDTLVSGPYLTFKPGSGADSREFVALDEAPILDQPGLKFTLQSNLKHSVSPGADILYKQVAVGTVYKYRLFSDHVEFSAQIHAPYAALLRANSVFWEESGVEFDLSLLGASMSTAPLPNLLRGSIALATPENPGARAEEGARFTLAEEPQKDWLGWRPTIEFAAEPVKREENKDPSPELLEQQ